MNEQNVSAEITWPRALTDWFRSERGLELLCLISVIVIPAIWALLTYDKLAVSSEGWYFPYAKMIRSGMVPYRDFELLYPPFYTYLMTAMTFVFGDSLLALRLIGVLLFVGITVAIYFVFKQIFSPWIAAIAAVIAIFIMNIEIHMVLHDYSRFSDLFNYLSLFLLLRVLVKLYKKEQIDVDLHMFILGCVCAVALFFRQTTGLFVFVYFIIFLIFLFLFVKDLGLRLRNLCYLFVGFSVPIVITALLLAAVGAFTPFVEMVFMGGSKGSITDMLYNWVPRFWETFKAAERMIAVLTLLSAAYLIFRFTRKDIDAQEATGRSDYLLYFAYAILTAAMIFVLFYSYDLSSEVFSHQKNLVETMFILNLVIGLMILIRVAVKFWKKEKLSLIEISYLLICGFIFVFGWGGATSNLLTVSHTALNFGFIVAVFFNDIEKVPIKKLKVCLKMCAMAFTVFLLATSVSGKVVAPYLWWNTYAEPYSEAVYTTDINYFRGIVLTAEEKYVYEDFVEKAGIYLSDDDDIYCYSQIAIFYTLADKVPVVKAAIPWFDVARDETVLEDLEYLKNNNPKMIVFSDHGWDAVIYHEYLFRDCGDSGQRFMYTWLLGLVAEAGSPGASYVLLETYRLHTDSTIYLLLRV